MLFSNVLAAADPLAAATSAARAVASLAKVPPSVGKRARVSRERRRAVYTQLDRTVSCACGAASQLAVLARSNRPDVRRVARTAMALASGITVPHPTLRRLVDGVTPVLRLAVGSDFLADAQHRHAVYRATDHAREAIAALTTALGDLRLVGNPGTQESAEAVIVLLGELFNPRG